jgi:hypothetical protein
MAVATDGDVSLGPVPADTSDQAAEKLADLLARRGLAGTQYHHHRPARCRIVDMDRQKAALVIMRVPLRQPLVAVHDVDRVSVLPSVSLVPHAISPFFTPRIALYQHITHPRHPPSLPPLGPLAAARFRETAFGGERPKTTAGRLRAYRSLLPPHAPDILI